MNQTVFAEKVGMTMRGYQSNERGLTSPSASTLKAYVELGISPLWLITGQGNMFLDHISKSFYKNTEESEQRSQSIVNSLTSIFEYFVEPNPPEAKVDNTREIYEEIGIKNHVAFNKLINELSEPFKSFYLLPVINPKNESAFHDFGSDLDLYNFHPVRRSWVADKKLDPKHLKAAFPTDEAMAPTIAQGEIAIIDDRASLSSSGIYVVSVQGKVFMRRVEHKINGLHLMTDNEHYSNEQLNQEDSKKVEVIGKVVRIDKHSDRF